MASSSPPASFFYPSPKYNLGDKVIIMEPDSTNRAGLVITWIKSPYKIMAKEYNRERNLWIYNLELVERTNENQRLREDVVLWGERKMVPMHKFDKDEYVTYQGRNWVIYKISLHKVHGEDEYKWGYYTKASKWVDNLRMEWETKSIWETSEGLEPATSPDMDNLIGGSLWRSYEPYVYGARFLYHVIKLTGRFDDENKVYYEDVTGRAQRRIFAKSMTKTRFVTGYIPLRPGTGRNWGHPKFHLNQTVRINDMLGPLNIPERMVITGLDLERMRGGTNGPVIQWWYRGHLEGQPQTAPYAHGMGRKEQDLSAVDQLLRSANNNSSSSSRTLSDYISPHFVPWSSLAIIKEHGTPGDIWEEKAETNDRKNIIKIIEVDDTYVRFFPWKGNGWDNNPMVLDFDSFTNKYKWVEHFDFKFNIGDHVIYKSVDSAYSPDQYKKIGLKGLNSSDREKLNDIECKGTVFEVTKREIRNRGSRRRGNTYLELQPVREPQTVLPTCNSFKWVSPKLLISAPKFKIFDYVVYKDALTRTLGSICSRKYNYINRNWVYEGLTNKDVEDPLRNYSDRKSVV